MPEPKESWRDTNSYILHKQILLRLFDKGDLCRYYQCIKNLLVCIGMKENRAVDGPRGFISIWNSGQDAAGLPCGYCC